jgi:signal transduction histidine kinase
MVYGFAKQSGGDLAIESEPGQGTRVKLWLPVASKADVQTVSNNGR